MKKKYIEGQILEVIQMYFNNEDWQYYLNGLKDKDEIFNEVKKIFKENEDGYKRAI